MDLLKTFLFLIIVFGLLTISKNSKKAENNNLKLGYSFIEPIPGGLGNYRSKQLTLEQMDSLYASGMIEYSIRMNGDGKDSGGVAIEDQKKICAKYDIRFEFVNLHGRGALNYIHEMLRGGKVHIHCKHGFDRTGGAVGYYLRRIGFNHSYVVRHNRWKNYLKRKGASYRVYWDMIK